MKKKLFTAVALIAFVGISTANSNVKTDKTTFVEANQKNEEKKEQEITADDYWFCYKVQTTVVSNGLSGTITTTETYRCIWLDI